jgi:hypothetical protein
MIHLLFVRTVVPLSGRALQAAGVGTSRVTRPPQSLSVVGPAFLTSDMLARAHPFQRPWRYRWGHLRFLRISYPGRRLLAERTGSRGGCPVGIRHVWGVIIRQPLPSWSWWEHPRSDHDRRIQEGFPAGLGGCGRVWACKWLRGPIGRRLRERSYFGHHARSRHFYFAGCRGNGRWCCPGRHRLSGGGHSNSGTGTWSLHEATAVHPTPSARTGLLRTRRESSAWEASPDRHSQERFVECG